jgi:hypothetical protein
MWPSQWEAVMAFITRLALATVLLFLLMFAGVCASYLNSKTLGEQAPVVGMQAEG